MSIINEQTADDQLSLLNLKHKSPWKRGLQLLSSEVSGFFMASKLLYSFFVCRGKAALCPAYVQALRAARLEAGHVLAQQPSCQSSHPITLGMTFKVGRRRRTKCPYLLCTSPAVEPLCSICGWVCLCVLWLWPDLVWHKDSCHISNLSHATQRRC